MTGRNEKEDCYEDQGEVNKNLGFISLIVTPYKDASQKQLRTIIFTDGMISEQKGRETKVSLEGKRGKGGLSVTYQLPLLF